MWWYLGKDYQEVVLTQMYDVTIIFYYNIKICVHVNKSMYLKIKKLQAYCKYLFIINIIID